MRAKVKRIKGRVSIYGGDFVILIADSLADSFKSVKSFKYDKGNEVNTAALFFLDDEAKTVNNRCYYLFLTPKASIADIVHECVHFKNAVYDYHEVKLDTNWGMDEHEAYFLDHLVNFVFRKIYPEHSNLYKK
jgi:hypothetical protein